MFSFRFDKAGFFSGLTLMILLGGTVLATILIFAIGGWNDFTILVWKWVVGTVWVLCIITVLVRVAIYRYQMLRGVNPHKREGAAPAKPGSARWTRLRMPRTGGMGRPAIPEEPDGHLPPDASDNRDEQPRQTRRNRMGTTSGDLESLPARIFMKVSIIGGGGLVGSMTAYRPAVRRRRQQPLPDRRQQGHGPGPGPRPAARAVPDRRPAHHGRRHGRRRRQQRRRHHRRPAPQARREPARPHQPQRRSVPGPARPGQGGRAQGRCLPGRRQQSRRCADLPGRAALAACRGSASSAWARSSTRPASAATWPAGCRCRRPRCRPSSSASTATAWCRSGRAPPSPACRWSNGPASARRCRRRCSRKRRPPAPQLIKLKGGSGFAVGLSIREVVQSLALDSRKVLPVSTLQQGLYGVRDVCLSVPTVVGCGGARQQIELALTPKERLGIAAIGQACCARSSTRWKHASARAPARDAGRRHRSRQRRAAQRLSRCQRLQHGQRRAICQRFAAWQPSYGAHQSEHG